MGAAAWSVVAVYVVLPAFGNAAREEFGPRFAGDRGDSFVDVVRYSLVHPFNAVDRALTPNDVGVLAMLVLTTGGLCLLAPRWLVVAVPAAALNLSLGLRPAAHDPVPLLDRRAGAVALAGAVGAGPVSACRLRRRGSAGALPRLSSWPSLTLQWVGAIARQIHAEWPRRTDRQAIVDAVPAGASVAAPMHALSHLADREAPLRAPRADDRRARGVKEGSPSRERAPRSWSTSSSTRSMRSWGAPTVPQVAAEIERRGFREVMRRGGTVLYRKEPGS